MIKRYVRLFCVLMAIVLTFSVHASAETVTPRGSAFFCSYDSFIDVITETKFEIWFDVVGAGIQDELGVSSIKVQRSADGKNWTTMMTFDPDIYTQMIVEDTYFVYDCVSYYGTVGYYYRAYITYYAKKGTGTGYLYEYSEVVYLSPKT